MLLVRKLVEDVIVPHPSKLRWRISETGLGCPVASELLNVDDSATLVYDTSTYSSEQSWEDAGHLQNVDEVVSMEFCASVIARKNANLNADAVYVSTFSFEDGKDTVGWIGISLSNFCEYYKITLPSSNKRGHVLQKSEAIRAIGNHGIILMGRALLLR